MNPLQRAAVRRKSLYFAAILALFTLSIFYRGLEAKTADGTPYVWMPFGRDDREAAPNGVNRAGDWFARQSIVSQSRRMELRELDEGEPDLAGEAIRLGLLGSRGFAVTYLWYTAIDKQKRNDFHEFDRLVKAVTTLQPHFITPWIFQSWNIAYNVSVEMHSMGDMYFYIARGIELLSEGERRNRRSPDMRWQLGFYYQNKFGVSDQVQTLRCLFQLSCIPFNERDPASLVNPADGTVDSTAFRQFCEKNPMLVRRLRGEERFDKYKKAANEGLRTSRPEDVIQFLRDNHKVPTRYKNATELKRAEEQFPALPQKFNGGEGLINPSEPTNVDASGFLAARAWFTYANMLLPPNPQDAQGRAIPSPTPRPDEYDQFKYRVPKLPMLIIFRQAPPRAQSYQAEMLQKDGWFDAEGWEVDAGIDAQNAWFADTAPVPGGGSMRQKPATPVRIGTGTAWTQEAWIEAARIWRDHGEKNGLILSPTFEKELRQDAGYTGSIQNVSLPEEPSPEQMNANDRVARRYRALAALFYYNANRQVTNFAFYLATSEVEQKKETIQARKTLWQADQTRRLGNAIRAIELYKDGLEQWKAVLLKNPNFHRTERLEQIEEQTYEYELEYLRLIAANDDRVRLKAEEEYPKEYERAARLAAAIVPFGAVEEYPKHYERLARVAAAVVPFGVPGPAPTSIPTSYRDAWKFEIAERHFSVFGGVMPLDLSDDRAGGPWVRPYLRESVLNRQGIVTARPQPTPGRLTPVAPEQPIDPR